MPARILDPDLLSTEHVAADLGLSVPTLLQRISRNTPGTPPMVRIGRRYAITPDAYAAWKRARDLEIAEGLGA
jgi:hypothetical protein